MLQQGQVFGLTSTAYRACLCGPIATGSVDETGSGCSEVVSRVPRMRTAALDQALEKLRRRGKIGRMPTLAEFVDEYLAQHEASPVTLEKLRFLLDRAVAAFGDYRLDEFSRSRSLPGG